MVLSHWWTRHPESRKRGFSHVKSRDLFLFLRSVQHRGYTLGIVDPVVQWRHDGGLWMPTNLSPRTKGEHIWLLKLVTRISTAMAAAAYPTR